jgi:hypothetical protein
LNRDRRQGLIVLLLLTCSFAGASTSALAASGTSGSGSIAKTQYTTPTPTQNPPLVPAGTPQAPAQQVLPAQPQSGGQSPAEAPFDTPTSDVPGDSGVAPATDDTAAAPTADRESGAAAPAQESKASTLPFTGALALPVAGAGLLLLGAGIVLRRRTAS